MMAALKCVYVLQVLVTLGTGLLNQVLDLAGGGAVILPPPLLLNVLSIPVVVVSAATLRLPRLSYEMNFTIVVTAILFPVLCFFYSVWIVPLSCSALALALLGVGRISRKAARRHG